jgi:nucleotide-binding universal stress UspA family protein
MFRNVLVGVNGDDGGRDAIELARRLVAEDGELTFAHVFDEGMPGPPEWLYPDVLGRLDAASELLERESADAGVQAHLRWRGARSVGRGLHELAEIVEADLLVVGSSVHAPLGRAALPDDTRAALNGAPCAIAVAPTGYRGEPRVPMREIGVGYDGSPESRHALGVARTLAAELGTRVSAFEAVSVPRYLYVGASGRVTAAAMRRAVDSALERIASLGGVEAHAGYGDPTVELTLYSVSLDLLVVGSRSYGPMGRLVHGSTSQHLTRTAHCPLLVLTRAARKASAPAGAPVRPLAAALPG